MFLITPIVAMVLASMAKKQIRESNGALTGEGLATAAKVISICFVVGIGLIVLLSALATPAILKQRKKMAQMESISNSRQIYLMMMDFEADNGTFPDDATAQEFDQPDFYRGDSSNRYLAQLIAGGYTMSESLFTTGETGYKEADELISPETEVLKKGENGWAYVLVDDKTEEPNIRGLSTQDGGDLPVLISALADISGNFNPVPYDGRYIFLRIDGSARNERINSPLDSPSWNEKFRPVVKMPE